jgi:hypothetical protein
MHRVTNPGRDDLLLIRIDPPLIGQKYGLGEHDIDLVLIATRHLGETLFPIDSWPVYVHVARPLVDVPEKHDKLSTDQYESVAWAELYPTEDAAKRKTI